MPIGDRLCLGEARQCHPGRLAEANDLGLEVDYPPPLTAFIRFEDVSLFLIEYEVFVTGWSTSLQGRTSKNRMVSHYTALLPSASPSPFSIAHPTLAPPSP